MQIEPTIKPRLSAANRIDALDILRGLAIFGMVWSGILPGALPMWMHHVQEYKNGVLDMTPGISWVDLVLPFFVFSMGAAIPISLNRRIIKHEPLLKLLGHIFYRGLLLMLLGLYLGNVSPWAMAKDPTAGIWLRNILGFGCWVLVLMRWPWTEGVRFRVRYAVRALGVIGLLVLMYSLHREDGTGFELARVDVIAQLLGFLSIVGSLVWLITRKSIPLRLAVTAVIFAVRMHSVGGGPIIPTLTQWLSPVSFLFLPAWIYWALVTIPSTIIGDMLLNWMNQRHLQPQDMEIPRDRVKWILLPILAILIGSLFFLYTRNVYYGFLMVLTCCLMILMITFELQSTVMKFLKTILQWAFVFLVIAYLMEPFEGGIKKSPANPQYYWMGMSLAMGMLVFFFIIADVRKKGMVFGLLRVIGSNALLAYIMGGQFVYPVLHFTGLMTMIDPIVSENITYGTIWSLILTFIVCITTYLFTRAKIYLRI